jgi:hypothetical protein
VELARDACLRANDFEYRRAIENTVETICNIIETDDAQEGLTAFNEKRWPPNGSLSPATAPVQSGFG